MVQGLILARAPLRVSLAGGGSDLPAFYGKHGGRVLSFAIDKFVYITLNPKFDGRVRMSYSVTENVEVVSQLQHDLGRAVLTRVGIDRGVEIVSVSDVPSTGTGLGASASYLTALICATDGYLGRTTGPAALADLAFQVEAEELGHPVGRQDHLAAAYGGINEFEIDPDGSTKVRRIDMRPELLEMLELNTLLIYTGQSRAANALLNRLKTNLDADGPATAGTKLLVDLVDDVGTALDKNDLETLGHLLDEGWRIKRGLLTGVSFKEIDQIYDTAMASGALGGKVTGAGGGGFLFLVVPRERRGAVIEALGDKTTLDFRVSKLGAGITYSTS